MFESFDNNIDRVHHGKEIYLVGHSLGGNLAIDVAVRFQNTIRGLILFSLAIYLKYEKLIKIFLPLYKRLFQFYRKPFKKSKQNVNNINGAYNVIPTQKLAELFQFINRYSKNQMS